MLAIREASDDKTSVNILPCRIDHNGPAKVTKRYWRPETEKDGTKTAYFRGRRLRGKSLKVPQGYKGLILKSTEKTLVEAVPVQIVEEEADDDESEEELPEPVKIIEKVSSFEEMTIWGHDHVPSAEDDFIKGVEEWIAFAEAIHKT